VLSTLDRCIVGSASSNSQALSGLTERDPSTPSSPEVKDEHA
jgi:hypothetical protein